MYEGGRRSTGSKSIANSCNGTTTTKSVETQELKDSQSAGNVISTPMQLFPSEAHSSQNIYQHDGRWPHRPYISIYICLAAFVSVRQIRMPTCGENVASENINPRTRAGNVSSAAAGTPWSACSKACLYSPSPSRQLSSRGPFSGDLESRGFRDLAKAALWI